MVRAPFSSIVVWSRANDIGQNVPKDKSKLSSVVMLVFTHSALTGAVPGGNFAALAIRVGSCLQLLSFSFLITLDD